MRIEYRRKNGWIEVEDWVDLNGRVVDLNRSGWIYVEDWVDIDGKLRR